MTPVAGFSVAQYPLWMLGCLLGEDWLHEDVLNSLLEMLYFTTAIASGEKVPSSLFLPTSFYTNARLLYHADQRQYSSNLHALRLRLQETVVTDLSSIACIDNHYSSFYDPNSNLLDYGDSMGHNPPSDLIPILKWVIYGLDSTEFVQPERFRDTEIARQGPYSGSCGIASLNLLECRANSRTPRWTCETSKFFRNKALVDLIEYHCVALGKGVRLRHSLLAWCTDLNLSRAMSIGWSLAYQST